MKVIDETVIPISKSLSFVRGIGFLILTLCSIWVATIDSETLRHIHIPRLFRFIDPHLAGYIGTIMFVTLFIFEIRFYAWAFNTKNLGLVITRDGLIDNTGPTSIGFVPWSEIKGAELHVKRNAIIVIVKLSNPERFLNRGSAYSRWLARSRFKTCGSPVVIIMNNLSVVDEKKLVNTINEYAQQ